MIKNFKTVRETVEIVSGWTSDELEAALGGYGELATPILRFLKDGTRFVTRVNLDLTESARFVGSRRVEIESPLGTFTTVWLPVKGGWHLEREIERIVLPVTLPRDRRFSYLRYGNRVYVLNAGKLYPATVEEVMAEGYVTVRISDSKGNLDGLHLTFGIQSPEIMKRLEYEALKVHKGLRSLWAKDDTSLLEAIQLEFKDL